MSSAALMELVLVGIGVGCAGSWLVAAGRCWELVALGVDGIVVVVVRSCGRCCSCSREGGCPAFVVGAVSAGIPAELVQSGDVVVGVV